MSRIESKDYIPTYGDYEYQREQDAKRAQEAKDRGFCLGKFKVTYTINGHRMSEVVSSYSSKDALDLVKQQCGMVGWLPIDMSVVTIDEPNVYV